MRLPNILFLMSDEHRADVTGYEGNDVIHTPFLDGLAKDGVVFRNAYTPSPICIPMRQCMMAGQLPLTCNCLRYGDDLPPFHMTFARWLSMYGYRTAAAGKLHHMGIDQMQGWTTRIGSMSVEGRHVQRQPDFVATNYSPPGCGKWSDAKEIQRAGVRGGPNRHTADDYTLQGSLDFIQDFFCSPYYDRPTPEMPLLLKVSFNRPHYPYFTGADKFNYYLNRVRPYLETEAFDHPFLGQRRVVPGKDVSEREIIRATAAYYGMIEENDDAYAQVADALAQVGQNLDDWIIIYTSDHGEMLGEHGIWEKQKFFEASARVPLIIRYPKRFQQRIVQQNVNLCDLFATLCDLSALPTPDGLDSRSLAPLMRGDASSWDDESISHFSTQRANNLMIKRGSLKYQYYGESMPEVLFDLAADPSECVNCIDDPVYSSDIERFRARRDELGYRQ